MANLQILNQTAQAQLHLPQSSIALPIIQGSEGEEAIDIETLRKKTGYITLDKGCRNTGTCTSTITFTDGEKGILRYRGYPIEELAEKTTFVEVAQLLLQGELPNEKEMATFSHLLTKHSLLHEDLRHHFNGFPPQAHPMAVLSAMINASSCYHPQLLETGSDDDYLEHAAMLMSKIRTIAAFGYKKTQGEPYIYPNPNRLYVNNFLHMMFALPYEEYEPIPEAEEALQLFFILHADHEQNCSTSTARIVGSSGANMFAAVASAVCALWGPLHGGANSAVYTMLQSIAQGDESVKTVVEKVKKKEFKLWGFGHRVYKNFDPRAKLLKKACDKLFSALGTTSKLLDIARELETYALEDDYFISRKLYPNVDFYSGILLNAVGIPLNMYPVMFAIGRLPGWMAHWKEVRDEGANITRPRQIYTGYPKREFTSIQER